jgi:hypothetical protein
MLFVILMLVVVDERLSSELFLLRLADDGGSAGVFEFYELGRDLFFLCLDLPLSELFPPFKFVCWFSYPAP